MFQIESLVRGIPNCPCGKDHICPIDFVRIAPDALDALPTLCEGYRRILLIADENTWPVCGQNVYARISAKAQALVLNGQGQVIVPNEEKISEIEKQLAPDTDLIIGVGSGVINDLCKHVSFTHDLPYFIVATAPSMDGYASVGAALILGGMKITLNARPPKAILADTKVLRDAPFDMIQSGWGDIIGKYSCLNDWRLSALIHGEYFCQQVYDLVMDCARQVDALAAQVVARDEEAIRALMEALVAVGIAMSYVGNSRPASGSEHHLAHYYEITGILHQQPYYPHGIDVLYSAVVTARLREILRSAQPTLQPFDRAEWETNIRRIYLSSADGIIALQDRLGWHDRDDSAAVTAKWAQICALLGEAPSEEAMRGMVKKIGLDMDAYDRFYGPDKITDGIRYAKDLKDRYTVLWLLDQFHAPMQWEADGSKR